MRFRIRRTFCFEKRKKELLSFNLLTISYLEKLTEKNIEIDNYPEIAKLSSKSWVLKCAWGQESFK